MSAPRDHRGTPPWARGLLRRPWFWASLASLGVSTAFWSPAFVRLDSTGFGDWQMVHHNWEVGWVALRRFGLWPLWDPYHCGGIPMLGHPESQHFSPFFWLSVLFGDHATVVAVKLMIVAHTAAGIAGGALWARRVFQLQLAPSALVGVAWSCSSFWGWHVAGGHATFAPFWLAPWLLLAWRAMALDLRYAAAVAGLMTLTVLEGGTYPFPYFVLLLAFESVVLLVRPPHPPAKSPAPRDPTPHSAPRGIESDHNRTRRRLLLGGAIAALLTALLGAIRFLPIFHTLALFPRTVASTDAMSLAELVPMFTRHDIPWHHPTHEYVWPEYANYVGWPVFLLGVAGAWVAIARRRLDAVLGFAVFTTLMLGSFAAWAPWTLLHHLPVFDSLRVPSRFTVFVSLYLSLLAGLALDAGWAATARRVFPAAKRPFGPALRAARLIAPWAIVVAILADPFVRDVQINDRWNGPPLNIDVEYDRFHLIPPHDYGNVYASLPRMNLGTPGCYAGNMVWRISPALWVGDVPQARVSRRIGRVVSARRTPREISVEVVLSAPGVVLLNQNHHPDWVASEGEVVEERGLLAVALPAGDHRFTVRYEPPMLAPGLATSGAGIVLLTGFLVWTRRRRSVRRGASVAPPADG